MPIAILLFIVVPIIEIAILLRVGEWFGWIPTLLIVITTAVIGTAMLRQQGRATLDSARQRMSSGEMPAQQLLEGLVIMIGGVLLLTPGFVTDTFGFLCLIPFTRKWLTSRVSLKTIGGFAGGVARKPGGSGAAGQYRPGAQPNQPTGHATGEIIDGDFKRVDDD